MELKKIVGHRLVRALRIVTPILVVILLAITTVNYLSRKRDQTPSPEAQSLPKDLAVLTEGFTFSRSEGGRTLFSIKAKRNLGFTDNKYMLEDVDVTVNGATDAAAFQRIRSKNCSYDEATNNIGFTGEVEVQLDDKTTGHTDELIYNHPD